MHRFQEPAFAPSVGKGDDEDDPDARGLHQRVVQGRLGTGPDRLAPSPRPASQLQKTREPHEQIVQGWDRQRDDQSSQISAHDNA